MKNILLASAAMFAGAGLVAAETTVQSCNRTVTFDSPPERAEQPHLTGPS